MSPDRHWAIKQEACTVDDMSLINSGLVTQTAAAAHGPLIFKAKQQNLMSQGMKTLMCHQTRGVTGCLDTARTM